MANFALVLLTIISTINPRMVTSQTRDEIKFIQPALNSFKIPLDEDAAIGTVIYTLKAQGGTGPLTFSIQTRNLKAELVPIDDVSAEIVLKQKLDAKQPYSVMCYVRDSVRLESAVHPVGHIDITDVNDNPPFFEDYQRMYQIKENFTSPNHLIFRLNATDSADTQELGTAGIVFEFELKDNLNKHLFRAEQQRSQTEAIFELYLEKALDYEQNVMHRITVTAFDNNKLPKSMNTTAAIVINVVDEDDNGPVFTKLASFTKLDENTPKGSKVFEIAAVDGDRDVKDPIRYSIVKGNENNAFRIDETTGEVFVEISPDRDVLNDDQVEIILGIKAQEVNLGRMSSETVNCTILIQDVNDEAPKFEAPMYTASVTENSFNNTAITLQGFDFISVTDKDQSPNAAFTVTLTTHEDLFYLNPSHGVNEAFLSLRVKNSNLLDYETLGPDPLLVKIKSEDKKDKTLTGEATVAVKITDENDLYPIFKQNRYVASVAENSPIGKIVLTVEATDNDTGLFGNGGIRYSILQLNTPFRVNRSSGDVTVGSPIDREKVSEYSFTIVARDNDGNGNSDSCEVVIKISDVNDNPPEFSSTNYRAVVLENEAKFQNALVIRAVDIDFEDNARVYYRITDVETATQKLPNDFFELVIGTDGVEMVVPDATRMDYEKLCPNVPIKCPLKVTVEAFDGGNPVLNNFTVVEVTLIDENDEIPKFVERIFNVSVWENDKSGALLAKVSATDDDVSPDFRQISYQIVDGSTQLFQIDSSTGEITVGKKANLDLDKVETDFFELSVIASDRKYRENNEMCKINIKILDVNNKPPYFDAISYEARINENSDINSKLTHEIRAHDPDSDFQLRYSFGPIKAFSPDKIESKDDSYYDNLFEIDANDGAISVKSKLDRETVEKLIITLVVNDTKTVEGKSSSTTSLTVFIDDYNDNAPWFGEKYYEGVVTENVAVGTEIRPVVTAIDVDLNQNVVFSLSDDSEFVEISKNGLLRVKSNIDRETHSSFTVTVTATDDGQPQLSNSTTYLLTVLDVNDNQPKFKPDNYEIAISEATEVGKLVLKVSATDADEGDFGKINFDFDQSKGQANFRIDNDTGEIFIASPLDRDTGTDVLELRVLARDNVKNPLQSLSSPATVTVRLLDENDNAPVINAVKGCVNVYEDVEQTSKLPHDLVTVTGTDPDDGENGTIVFSLATNNSQLIKDLFDIKSLNAKSGILYVRKSLKGLIKTFPVLVTARDRGKDVQIAKQMEIINVCVHDVNDHKPVIHYPTPGDKIWRKEDLEVQKGIVFHINASDDDVDDDNKRLIYMIKSFNDTFEADVYTGKVTLIKHFDRKIRKWYEVNFEVCDSGKPAALCTSGSCRVIVESLHNKQPEFNSRFQKLQFTEETDPGVESNVINAAIDEDHDSSGLPTDLKEEHEKAKLDICYFVVGGAVNSFDLNKSSGTLVTRVKFDYESKKEYKLIVIATNDCESVPPGVGADVDEANLSKSHLILTIEIVDVNDNPPKFTQKIFGGGIDNRATPGQVLQLNAVDADSGENALVRYAISGDIVVVEGENIGVDEKKNSWFVLDEVDGFVSSNYQFSENMKGYVQFDVRVENRKSLVSAKVNSTFDTALVKIYILRHDQKSVFIIRKSKDEFWSTRESFANKLSNLTGTIANINSVVPYVDPVTSITRPEWCVVSVHYVNRDNDVIDPSTVEEFLDSDYKAQSQLANEFAVHEVNKQVDSKKSQEIDPITTSIYAVAGALVLILTAFLALYCSRVSKLKLQLKASSLSTYSAMNRKQSLAPELPTTNLHAKPASNPIYDLDDGVLGLSDTSSIASEGSFVNNENNFEGGLNNGGFAGLLENMISMENEENIDTSKAINDNFVLRKSNDSILI